MQKLILTSLGIISIPLLFLTYTNKEPNSSINKDRVKIEKQNSEKENFSTLILPVNTSNKHLAIINKISKEKQKIDQRTDYLAYLDYRKEQHQYEQEKMNHYLTHQKNLKHIREGGVKSELQKEKRKHEVQFQHQYQSTMMSQTKERQENFVKQNKKMKERREHMQSLKDRQILQTKYRGEL